MSKFTYITDTHFSSSSNVRTGNYLEDLLEKLEFVVNKTNELDAVLLHGGDLFDKPTVTDFVKFKVLDILEKLKYPMLVIPGNHDSLFNDFFARKDQTSLNLLTKSSKVELLNGTKEYSDCFVSSKVPVITRGKPQIVLIHGFLNTSDTWNIGFDQIQTKDKSFILLGHDHTPHEDLKYGESLILRKGSFTRAIREDSSDRIPVMLSININKDDLTYTEIPISVAKPVELLFKDKLDRVQKSDITYEDLVKKIQEINLQEDSLMDSLRLVTQDKRTLDYLENTLKIIY